MSSEVKITGIPSKDIDTYWSAVEPLLKKATDRGTDYLIVDLYEQIDNGTMQLWVAFDDKEILAACTTKIITYPRLRVCGLTHIGGKGMRDWLRFEPIVSEWAKEHGCSHLEGYARPGWLRVLKHWATAWTVIRKEL